MASRKFGKAIWELLLHIVVHSFDERSQSDAADSSTMTRVTSVLIPRSKYEPDAPAHKTKGYV